MEDGFVRDRWYCAADQVSHLDIFPHEDHTARGADMNSWQFRRKALPGIPGLTLANVLVHIFGMLCC